MPTFSFVIRCDDNGHEDRLITIEANDPQKALDLLMIDLKQLIRDYDANPNVFED